MAQLDCHIPPEDMTNLLSVHNLLHDRALDSPVLEALPAPFYPTTEALQPRALSLCCLHMRLVSEPAAHTWCAGSDAFLGVIPSSRCSRCETNPDLNAEVRPIRPGVSSCRIRHRHQVITSS